MSDLDTLIRDKVVPIRKKVVDALSEKHPRIFSVLQGYLAKNKNRMALRVTENGQTIGEYTFYLDGLYIDKVESGVLDSAMHHPFGVIKPYGIVEKRVLEELLADEQKLVHEPFGTIKKYLPDITLKFLK